MREWLYNARKSAGKTMKEVADSIGISESYYSLIERGDRQKRMDVTLIIRLSETFSIPVDEIVRNET